MADKTIGELVSATTIGDSDLFVLQQDGVAKNITGETVANYIYAASGATKEEIDELLELFPAIKATYGAPLVASTVADMTDHTHVYVYTGSETGYTSGNWYYWDGSAWTSGGIYNSTAFETDITLSVSGAAADAAVTGGVRDAVNDALYPVRRPISNSDGLYLLVANQGILMTTGGLISGGTRSKKYCRTYGIQIDHDSVLTCPVDGYVWQAWAYSSSTLNATNAVRAITPTRIDSRIPIYYDKREGETHVAVCWMTKTEADMTTDQTDPTSDLYKIKHAFDIHYKAVTDDTLSEPDVPADAAAVGAALAAINADAYDNTATYDVGDYCLYGNALYKCVRAITSPGDWDATNWIAVQVTSEIDALREQYTARASIGPYSVTNTYGLSPTSGAETQNYVGMHTGSIPFSSNVLLTLGLDDYRWTCYAYSSTYLSAGTHSNSHGMYVDGTCPILCEYQDGDAYMRLGVVRKDGATFTIDTTDPTSDIYKVNTALKAYVKAGLTPRIMWFGDSITRGIHSGGSSGVYSDVNMPILVQQETGLNIDNYGIGSIGWLNPSSDSGKGKAIDYLQRVGDQAWYCGGPWNYSGNNTKFLCDVADYTDYNTIILSFGANDRGVNSSATALSGIPSYTTSTTYAVGDYTVYAHHVYVCTTDIPSGEAWNADHWQRVPDENEPTVMIAQTVTDSATYDEVMAQTPNNIIAAVYQCYRYLAHNAPSARIIITDPLIQVGSGSAPQWSLPTYYSSAAYRAWTWYQYYAVMEAFCNRYGIGHISTLDAPINRMTPQTQLADNVHPTQDCYRQLARYFAGKISALVL